MQPITSLIGNSFGLFKSNFKDLMYIVALPALIAGIAAFFEPVQGVAQSAEVSLTFLVATVFSVIASILMTIALIYKIDDPSLGVNASYKRSAGKFFKYLLLVIVLTIILIPAFLLLILPGIWLSVAFSFAMFFLLLQNASIKNSLKASFNLVKGHWWAVFGRAIILGLIGLVFVIILEFVFGFFGILLGGDMAYGVKSALSFILTPFSTAYMYLMFKDLLATKGGGIAQ